MTCSIKILVVALGDIDALDAGGEWRSLVGSVTVAANAGEARAILRENAFDLTAIILDRRGQISLREVAELQQLAPLCRFVAVTGPLCEGVWRRGPDLLPGITLIPAIRWAAWLRCSAGQIGRGLPPAWSLPNTAAADELAEFWSQARISPGQGLVHIDCESRDAAEAIGDVVALAGYASSWHPPGSESFVQGAAAVVVEADGWSDALSARIQGVHRQYAPVPLLLVMNFPLPGDVSAAIAVGATAVLSKPFTLSEFLGQLSAAPPAAVPHSSKVA